MKKLLLLSALLIFACSDDDSSSDNIGSDYENILPTRQSITRSINGGEGEELRIYDYYFAGNKHISTTRTTSGWYDGSTNNRTETYNLIYEGELVIRTIWIIDYTANGEIDSEIEYEYEYDSNDRLIKITKICPVDLDCSQYIENYNYLNNGLTIQVTNVDNELKRLENYDNNLNLIDSIWYDENENISSTYTWIYDDKNNWSKNAETFGRFGNLSPYVNANNVIEQYYNNDLTYSWVFEYNQYDFPVSRESNDGTRSYTYEYNID